MASTRTVPLGNKRLLLFAALCGLHAWAAAQAVPVGLYKTIDDETHKEKALVRLTETGGVLSGTVEKILDPAGQDAKCGKCTDELKNKPILGLPLLRNVTRNPDERSLWEGGEILDPKNGKFYKVRIKVLDGGQNLEVRGYIGLPMLGRTQTWSRVE
jgi:uncharacterized protein (DUF2147 family)